jgi:hypothetical protein
MWEGWGPRLVVGGLEVRVEACLVLGACPAVRVGYSGCEKGIHHTEWVTLQLPGVWLVDKPMVALVTCVIWSVASFESVETSQISVDVNWWYYFDPGLPLRTVRV